MFWEDFAVIDGMYLIDDGCVLSSKKEINLINTHMKKAILFMLAVFIGMGTLQSAFAIPLKDVDEGDKYTPAIRNLYEMEVIQGYPDGTFRPEGSLNRAELLKIVMLAAQIESTGELSNCFNDVGDEWFAEYVCMAKDRGWVEGYADGSFKPGQMVNRVEALKMMLEVFNVELLTSGYQRFADVNMDDWFANYVATAESWQILETEIDNVQYAPGADMARGVFAYNVDNLLTEEAARYQSAVKSWVCDAYAKGSNVLVAFSKDTELELIEKLNERGFKVDSTKMKDELENRQTVKIEDILSEDFDGESYCN